MITIFKSMNTNKLDNYKIELGTHISYSTFFKLDLSSVDHRVIRYSFLATTLCNYLISLNTKNKRDDLLI